MDVIHTDEPLFCRGHLDASLRNAQDKVKTTVDCLGQNELLGASLDDVVERIAHEHAVAPLELDEAGMCAEQGEAKIPMERLRDGMFRLGGGRGGGPRTVDGHEVRFVVPFTGNPELFGLQPNSFSLNPPRGSVRGRELVFTFLSTDVGPHLKQAFEKQLSEVKTCIRNQAHLIDAHNDAVANTAKRLLKERIGRLRQADDAATSLGVPLRRRGEAPTTYVAPEVRRKLPPHAPTKPAPKASAALEPILPEAEYQHILKVMRNMAVVLEMSPSAFEAIGEEGIRWHFIVQLNGQYGGQATGETFNFKGKTDILVRSGDRNIFVAECKFWKGPKGLSDTIDQLLGYLTWRDTKAAIVIFNREVKLSTVLSALPEALKSHRSCKAPVKVVDETTFSTTLTRPDDADRHIALTVMVFDVPQRAERPA